MSGGNNQHTRTKHKRQHRNQNHNGAELLAEVSIGARFNEAPHFLHAVSAFVLGNNLGPQDKGIHNAKE